MAAPWVCPSLFAVPWVNDPAGPLASEIVPVYWIMFGLAVLVLIIVDGALIYAGIKFRERPGRVAKQFHGHNLLELTWTVIPTAMVIFLAVISFDRLLYINDADSASEMTVQVEGRQWTFVYTYPDEPLFRTANSGPLQGAEELHIPVNTKVKLELSARDVIHSFWVPQLGGKKDAVPGRATDMWLMADRTGTFKGQCTEFCGDGHADMLITVVVHDRADFEAWAREAVAAFDRRDSPEAREGRELFMSLPCAGCHTIAGTPAQGRFPGAPELTSFATQEMIADVLELNEENLARWLADPPAVKPGTQMPDLGLDEETIDALVQYLLTLDGS